MGKLWDAVWYNGGRGPSDGNNYWRRFTAAHYVYVGVMLTLMGAGIGLVALFTGSLYPGNQTSGVFISYLHEPLILLLNLLPGLLIVALVYFATGRAWAAFAVSGLIVMGGSLAEFYKMGIRSETLVASDLGLIGEAVDILPNYTLELTGRPKLVICSYILGLLFAIFLMRGKLKNIKVRVAGSLLTLAAIAALLPTVYFSDSVAAKVVNDHAGISIWVEQQVFVSKGFVYSFLHSVPDAFPGKPEGYDRDEAKAELDKYTDSGIDGDKKVDIIAVMLEAYADLSEFDEVPVYDEVYAPLRELRNESLHGHELSNVFGGGTVDTERNFLTGYPHSKEYRGVTDSYLWYLRDNGYRTEGLHTGDGWFYNRENVERNLGMEDYYFLDDFPDSNRTDEFFFRTLTDMYEGRDKSVPYFNFSVTYQNHGSYDSGTTGERAYLERGDLSEGNYNILNNYFTGIADTGRRLAAFVDSLRDRPEPVVVVFFGDHQPYLGAALEELGVNMDLGTEEGFYNYYSTPYIIWANDAAKAVTGGSFTGEGGDMSSCFLMGRVFEECGWTGSQYEQMNREVRSRVTMINTGSDAWVVDGRLVRNLNELDGDTAELIRRFEWAEYYTKENFSYGRLTGG